MVIYQRNLLSLLLILRLFFSLFGFLVIIFHWDTHSTNTKLCLCLVTTFLGGLGAWRQDGNGHCLLLCLCVSHCIAWHRHSYSYLCMERSRKCSEKGMLPMFRPPAYLFLIRHLSRVFTFLASLSLELSITHTTIQNTAWSDLTQKQTLPRSAYVHTHFLLSET